MIMLGAKNSFAQSESVIDSGDTSWMMISTALVLLMAIPGLALFYGGMVRKKNVLAMTTQVFAIAALASLIWFAVGYSLSFSDGGSMNAWIGGLENVFLSQLAADSASGTIPESVFVIFQMTFAIITPALIVGAFADRMKFSSVMIFSALWLVFVYFPVCHWVWGGGFLSEEGVLDFAGGTVVHINAGVAGLVAAIVLGPRKNYGRENMAPHNLVLSMIGGALLWVGWFGFNAGSALTAGNGAGMAMLVTQIAAASGCLAWMMIEGWLRKKASLLGALSGAIAGLVAITPAAGFVGPMDAFLIGAASGLICFWVSTSVKRKFGYDDSLDVFGIHGIGGIVGALLTGVFAREAIGGTAGMVEGNAGQVWIQFIGLLATIGWSAIVSFILLKLTGLLTGGLRVSKEAETEGLDIHEHGEVIQ
ncbi:MAG: ammonium transporter [Alphaproteobacteria bacterium]